LQSGSSLWEVQLILGMASEPFVEIGLLGGAKLYAGVDVVEGFGKSSFGGIYGVTFEEGSDLVAKFLSAEGAGGGYYSVAGISGELGLDLAPVVADVVPGLLLCFALLEEMGEKNPTVLVSNLTRDGVVEGAVDESNRLEVGKKMQTVCEQAGVTGVAAKGEGFLIELVATCAGCYSYSDVGEGGVEGLVGFGMHVEDASTHLIGLRENGRISGLAEGLEEDASELLAVEGLVLLRRAEGCVDGAELAAEDRVERIAVFVGGDAILDGADFAESGVDDGSVGVLFQGENEVEEFADFGVVGIDECPAIAEEADALGGGEGGFGCGGYSGVLLRGVEGAVVAAGGGVGVEDGEAGVHGDGHGCVRGLKNMAKGASRGFETDRDGPLLSSPR
jgi:hypothetical protein